MSEYQILHLPVGKLHEFKDHPYRVAEDDEMRALASSVRANGVLSPILVRPLEDAPGEYEVISGHRRLYASQMAGLPTVPAFVLNIDRDAAAIMLVDSNLHREHILPSEKAFAYKMKLDAIRHQGKHIDDPSLDNTVVRESADLISGEDSGRQVQRYIRLTYLVPDLLRLVDEGRVAFTPAVNLSYLTEEEQGWVLDEMAKYDCTPSNGQAILLKQKSLDDTLTKDFAAGLLCQEKANQRETLRIPLDRLNDLLPAGSTPRQKEDYIVKACTFYRNHLKRMREETR